MPGKAIVFSAPSGSGKTTIVRELMSLFPELGFSVSATTRLPREGEVNGRDYYFMSLDEFRKKLEHGAFIETEEVYSGLYYGTLKSEIDRLWAAGKNVIFDVDVKGGLALKKYFGADMLAIFVAVPSPEILRERLQQRGSETEESLNKRLAKAAYETTFSKDFDVVVVNDRMDHAVAQARAAYLAFASEG